VIRGVDHLTNAARQAQIYRLLGWEVPAFAHIPLILGPDGAKLSKRKGAPGLETFRAMGFLPAGLRNYLARLGWSHGDDEIFSTEQMIEWFDIADINKAPARLDPVKMADVNAHYIRQSSDAELLRRIQEFLPEAEGGPELAAKFAGIGWDKLAAALPSLKGRAKTLRELVDGAGYLIATRPLAFDDKAAKALDHGCRGMVAKLLPRFEAAPEWQVAALEGLVRAFCEAEGAKLGAVAQPLRAALTGKSVSPPVFDVMVALGRDEALARLRDQAS
jgi:glutamyl-tRNA synthetase